MRTDFLVPLQSLYPAQVERNPGRAAASASVRRAIVQARSAIGACTCPMSRQIIVHYNGAGGCFYITTSQVIASLYGQISAAGRLGPGFEFSSPCWMHSQSAGEHCRDQADSGHRGRLIILLLSLRDWSHRVAASLGVRFYDISAGFRAFEVTPLMFTYEAHFRKTDLQEIFSGSSSCTTSPT